MNNQRKYNINKLLELARKLDIEYVENVDIETSVGGLCVSSAKDHEHLSLESTTSFVIITIIPNVIIIPMFVTTLLYPCLNYTGSLNISIISIYAACFAISYIHIVSYSFITNYCTEKIIVHHLLHVIVFYCFMGASLGFYCLYAYDANAIYYFLGLGTALGTLIQYFVCVYQRHYIYYCEDSSCNEIPDTLICCDTINYEDMFSALGVLFILAWISFIVVPISLREHLYDPMRDLEFCKNITY